MVLNNIPRRKFVQGIGSAGMILGGAGVTAAAQPQQRNFRTHLSGDAVVPPVDTNAQGQAKFQLSKAGDELSFKLNVANIDDVIGAHIHQAPAGENGGIVVFLFGDPFTDPVTVNGTLAGGTITATDVVGSIAGDLDALVTAMREGDTYVQVHTEENVPGEIRGQIH
jgi:Cu/Zn superoxide dismutase